MAHFLNSVSVECRKNSSAFTANSAACSFLRLPFFRAISPAIRAGSSGLFRFHSISLRVFEDLVFVAKCGLKRRRTRAPVLRKRGSQGFAAGFFFYLVSRGWGGAPYQKGRDRRGGMVAIRWGVGAESAAIFFFSNDKRWDRVFFSRAGVYFFLQKKAAIGCAPVFCGLLWNFRDSWRRSVRCPNDVRILFQGIGLLAVFPMLLSQGQPLRSLFSMRERERVRIQQNVHTGCLCVDVGEKSPKPTNGPGLFVCFFPKGCVFFHLQWVLFLRPVGRMWGAMDYRD